MKIDHFKEKIFKFVFECIIVVVCIVMFNIKHNVWLDVADSFLLEKTITLSPNCVKRGAQRGRVCPHSVSYNSVRVAF